MKFNYNCKSDQGRQGEKSIKMPSKPEPFVSYKEGMLRSVCCTVQWEITEHMQKKGSVWEEVSFKCSQLDPHSEAMYFLKWKIYSDYRYNLAAVN